ncbi:uncharacterized protein LOC109726868 [Ananas comosus]|uniref:Uncharacterized protein LOC109726868 n=1 Tax=Ananas comosus TaxID=4615 RepID=A0A199UJ61_ANACO|nr:uncharacterized protein LOC109726868 [Ananas comosus]XP_020112285.1 uncharacterized protein LOC109726868 [Ananas comosus]XP_020112286.1 uncharacterized protein LOC109726868 [Ananas comosus]OAY64741.1 hypothetical protein ACMD2_03689 [Ananas comosus]
MDKLVEFGRKAWFIVRVLSGYEERRIRSYRLLLQKRIEQSQTRKQELRRIPEQAILSEVRRMVEEMQALNRQLDETEAAIEEYFKPIDKHAQVIMNMQLEKEEKQMKEMVKAMQEQMMAQREMVIKQMEAANLTSNHPDRSTPSTHSNQEQVK